MIRVREVVMRDAAGAEVFVKVKLDYDAQSIRSDMSRRDGKPLPNGSVSHGTVNLPGGFTEDVGEFDLEEIAVETAEELIDEGRRAGFAVTSDETINYPEGVEAA